MERAECPRHRRAEAEWTRAREHGLLASPSPESHKTSTFDIRPMVFESLWHARSAELAGCLGPGSSRPRGWR